MQGYKVFVYSNEYDTSGFTFQIIGWLPVMGMGVNTGFHRITKTYLSNHDTINGCMVEDCWSRGAREQPSELF